MMSSAPEPLSRQNDPVTDPELNLPGHGGHRPLNEDVLQSAEDALKSSATPVVLYTDDMDVTAKLGAVPPKSHLEITSGSGAQEGGHQASPLTTQGRERATRWLSGIEGKATQYVALKPLRAAALAVGVGAVVATLLGRLRRGKR